MSGEPETLTPPWAYYRRTGLSEMRPYVPGEDLTGISVSDPDKDLLAAAAESGEDPGGYVARNPKNHADQWYVAQTYFDENLEPLEEPVVARDEAAELRAAIKAWAKALDAESGAQSATYAVWRAAQDRLGEAEERLYALAATEGQS